MATLFTNQALLTYNNGQTTLSNIVQGSILDAVTITKTAVNDDYIFGDDVTYYVSITNNTGSDLTSVSFVDNLGQYPYGAPPVNLYPLTYVGPVLHFRNGAAQANIVPLTTSPTLTLTIPLIPAGGNVLLVYEVDVNEYAPLDVEDSIENIVTVSGGGIVDPVTATETIYTSDIPQLAITKNMSPNPVADNSTLTYTFILENYGNTASTDVVLTDTFDPALATGITVTLDGSPLTITTQYTYTAGTGAFATISGVITIPAATYAQDGSGVITVTPGAAILVVSGTI